MERKPVDESKLYNERILDISRIKRMDVVQQKCVNAYGKTSLLRLTDEFRSKVKGISTGSLALNIATGIGGIPQGRITELFGPESAGKTTLALHLIANAQREGGVGYFVDAEHALDTYYAESIGVSMDYLMVSQPDTAEEALGLIESIAKLSETGDIIVLDSVAGMVPKAELEGDMGDSHMGVHARLMGQAMRKLTGIAEKIGVAIVFINQIREKIGVVFGNLETTPGGRALKFFSSMRLDIRRIGQIKVGEEQVGNRTRVKVIKSKVSPPFKLAEFDILYGDGISAESEMLEIGVECGVVEKSGAWYSFGGERLGQGKENTRKFLIEHEEIADKISTQMLEKLNYENKKTEDIS